MQKPDAATVAWYQQAIPADPRAVPGQMFGHPCAFTSGNMFLGTFGNSVIVRVGEQRAAALSAEGPGRIFVPMEGRGWKEYLQLDYGAVPAERLAELAAEALDFTAGLPAKVKGKASKGTAGKGTAKAGKSGAS